MNDLSFQADFPPVGALIAAASAPQRKPATAGTDDLVRAINLVRGGMSMSKAAETVRLKPLNIRSALKWRGWLVADVRQGPEWTRTPEGVAKVWARKAECEALLRKGLSFNQVVKAMRINHTMLTQRRASIDAGLWDAAVELGKVRRARGGYSFWRDLTTAQMDRMRGLIAGGATLSEVAEAFQISQSALRNGLHDRGEAALLAQMSAHAAARHAAEITTRRKQLITDICECLRKGFTLRRTAEVLRVSGSTIFDLRGQIPADLWPSTRPKADPNGLNPDLLRRMADLVAGGTDMTDLRHLVGGNAAGVVAFLTRHDRADLAQQAQTQTLARTMARRREKAKDEIAVLTDILQRGKTIHQARQALPWTKARFSAVLPLLDADLLARARALSMPAKMRALVRPSVQPAATPVPVAAPPVARVAVPAPPPIRPIAASAFDVKGADAASLAETKGRAAALADWAKAHGLSMAQAVARWHRLPPAVKGF